jgi:hypothetical protein
MGCTQCSLWGNPNPTQLNLDMAHQVAENEEEQKNSPVQQTQPVQSTLVVVTQPVVNQPANAITNSGFPPTVQHFFNSVNYPNEMISKKRLQHHTFGYSIAENVSDQLYASFMSSNNFSTSMVKNISHYQGEVIVGGEIADAETLIHSAIVAYFTAALGWYENDIQPLLNNRPVAFFPFGNGHHNSAGSSLALDVKYIVGDIKLEPRFAMEACYSQPLQQGIARMQEFFAQTTEIDVGIVVKIIHPHTKMPNNQSFDLNRGLYVLFYYERTIWRQQENNITPLRIISIGDDPVTAQDEVQLRAITGFPANLPIEGYTTAPNSPVLNMNNAGLAMYNIRIPARSLLVINNEINTITNHAVAALNTIPLNHRMNFRLVDLKRYIKGGVRTENDAILYNNAVMPALDPNFFRNY